MLSLMTQGLSSEQAVNLLTHRTVGIAQSESGVLDGVFDASDRLEGEDLIYWWNDFEKDNRYMACLFIFIASVDSLMSPLGIRNGEEAFAYCCARCILANYPRSS